MNPSRRICIDCGAMLRPHGSDTRISGGGKEKVRRYKCMNGHWDTEDRLKEIYEAWVKYLAVRLHDRGENTRTIAKKIEAFIAETCIAQELGKEKFAHTTIHYWIKGGVDGLISKAERNEQILDAMPEIKERNGAMVKTEAGWHGLDLITSHKRFKAALAKWIDENPVVKDLMERLSLARGSMYSYMMLFATWQELEDDSQKVKRIRQELSKRYSEAFSQALSELAEEGMVVSRFVGQGKIPVLSKNMADKVLERTLPVGNWIYTRAIQAFIEAQELGF